MLNKSLLTLSVCLMTGSLALAGVYASRPHVTDIPAPSGKVAPWEAMKIATKKTGGRALGANFEFDDGHWIYGVTVVTKGKLQEVEIDPTSGKIGEVENITPDGEAKETKSDLQKALKG
jgi:hypothetical protein